MLFPYIAEYPYFVISEDKDLLFYNGYAIVCDDLQKLKVLQKILRSEVFWYYIKHTSKPYGSNYFALAKNYVKNFGLIELSGEQEDKILSLRSDVEINNFVKVPKSKEELEKSIKWLLDYEDDTILYPGHYDSTTLGHERKNNPYLK